MQKPKTPVLVTSGSQVLPWYPTEHLPGLLARLDDHPCVVDPKTAEYWTITESETLHVILFLIETGAVQHAGESA